MFGMMQLSCDCYNWERYRLLCKYFCVVFFYVLLWLFDKFLDVYKDLFFFILDGDLFIFDNLKVNDYIGEESMDDLFFMIGEEVVEGNDGKELLRFEDLLCVVLWF